MFSKLKNLFSPHSNAPKADPALVDFLVEIASPNIKLARKYQDRIAPYAYWAESHAAQFATQLSEPIALTVENWRQMRLLQLLFATPNRMGELIGQDAQLQAWFSAHPQTDSACLVFTARSSQKMRYGMVEEEGKIRRDVPQQVLIFDQYHLGIICESEQALQTAGSKRILETVAHQASLSFAQLEAEKAELEDQLVNARTMLRMSPSHSPGYQAQQQRIEHLCAQLQSLNEARSPDALCEQLITELAATPDILTLEHTSVIVDAMGVIASGIGNEQEIKLSEIVLQRQEPIRRLILTLSIPRSLMQAPAQRSAFTGDAQF
jgi:hypothetical protein